jgi:hypothetical protein
MPLKFADSATGSQCPVSTITAPELVLDLSIYAAEAIETDVCADPIQQASHMATPRRCAKSRRRCSRRADRERANL